MKEKYCNHCKTNRDTCLRCMSPDEYLKWQKQVIREEYVWGDRK